MRPIEIPSNCTEYNEVKPTETETNSAAATSAETLEELKRIPPAFLKKKANTPANVPSIKPCFTNWVISPPAEAILTPQITVKATIADHNALRLTSLIPLVISLIATTARSAAV